MKSTTLKAMTSAAIAALLLVASPTLAKDMVIHAGKLIDGIGATARSKVSVIIKDDRIVAVEAGYVTRDGDRRDRRHWPPHRCVAIVSFRHYAEQDAVKSPKVGLRGDEAIGRSWDELLTVAASGEAPALKTLDIVPVKVRRVLIAGDSTVTDQAGGDYASWGQMLPRFLSPDLSVANHARGGETMKSFITSLRWDKLLSETRSGDVVLIQFAHNDEKKQWPRTYAAASGAYPAYLAAFVADVRQRGAYPVLITPVARRTLKDGKIENSHGGYDQAVRDVAANLKVPLIDLTEKTARLYEALGPEVSPLAFANDGKDKTHHNAYGAFTIACYVAQDLVGFKDLNLKGAEAVTPCDPSKPADPKAFELAPADWPIMRAKAVITQTAEPTPVK